MFCAWLAKSRLSLRVLCVLRHVHTPCTAALHQACTVRLLGERSCGPLGHAAGNAEIHALCMPDLAEEEQLWLARLTLVQLNPL